MLNKKQKERWTKAQTLKGVSLSALSLFFFLLLIFNVSALTYKQNSDVDFKIPTNDSGCFVTISYPNSTIALSGIMDDGVGYSIYSIDNSYLIQLGEYTAFSNCSNEEITFEVTPSGYGDSNNIVFYVVLLVGLYTLNLIGFFKRNAAITILGGIGLTFLGLYMVNNGIIIFRDNLTLAISYITLFWGLGSSLWAGIESIDT